MNFTVSTNALNECLQTLAKVINTKNSLPILECFLFEVKDSVLNITASDSENTIRSSVKLENNEGQGSFAVPNRMILGAVKELPEQPLKFEVDLEKLTIKISYQNGFYNFTAQNAEEYPMAQTLPDGTNVISIGSNLLIENLNRSLFATAEDELRPVMNGVYFDMTRENLTIVATDGHKLVENQILTIKGDQSVSFVLPKKPAILLKGVLKKDSGDVVIKFDNRSAEIIFEGGVLSCRLIDGVYPDYQKVIPKDNPNQLVIDRLSLLGALRRVVPFASESSELVRFHLTAGNVELTSQDIDFATSAKENIVCEYAGQNMDIGFKGSSLTDILTNLDSETITVQLSDPSRAGVVSPTEQPKEQNVQMLIMPMLLTD